MSLPESLIRWVQKATQNVVRWGDQDLERLALAMTEELGELTRAILEHEYEEGEFERIQEELDDLTALMLQMQFHLDRESDDDD